MWKSTTTGLQGIASLEVLQQYKDRFWRSCGRRDRTNNEGVQMEKGSCGLAHYKSWVLKSQIK
ncbi:hypothetical protein HKD37_06G017705 [Glycine soja]